MIFSNLLKNRTPYKINSQFKPEDPSDKTWYRNRKIWHRIFFQMNVTKFFSNEHHLDLWSQKTALDGDTKSISPNRFYLTLPHDNS